MNRILRTLSTLLLVAGLLAGGFYLYTFYQKGSPEVIEQQFISGIPTIFRTPGGNLEVAGFTATETFRRATTARLPFTDYLLPFSTTVTVIHVPVTYRYHIRVFDPWQIDIRSNTCVIYAPEIRPTLPPAIHTDKMMIYSDEGLLSWDGEAEIDSVLRKITPTLTESARKPETIAGVREEARKTVAEFVRMWLINRGNWGEEITQIKVIFRDELPLNPEMIPPALEFQPESETP